MSRFAHHLQVSLEICKEKSRFCKSLLVVIAAQHDYQQFTMGSKTGILDGAEAAACCLRVTSFYARIALRKQLIRVSPFEALVRGYVLPSMLAGTNDLSEKLNQPAFTAFCKKWMADSPSSHAVL